MIIIDKVNKYFNRRKRNEIHVINNTTLKLEDTGLVALLGPSGCGKTTLLNVIGGLDKVNSGKVLINGDKITKTCSCKIDKIRNLNIGYIFQDFHLINDKSVYDNVALVLKMIGIKDKNEIKTRVDYVLNSVGMYRYRKRLAGMLSGGERQRVAIARAIVKNPSIIIADEPTGNLDSKNTIEIMNIIKSISKDKLVILVTHEKELANFYATRIIELKDGVVISDKENSRLDDLDYKIDNKIYLKDIKNNEKINKKNIDINLYSDDEEKISIDIVVKNGNIYLKTNDNRKIEVVDNNSSIEFVNDNYKKITKKDYENHKFNFNEIVNDNIKYKYSSIFNIFTLITNGFKKVFNYPVLKKLLLVGFFVSGMFILYSISNIFGITQIKDENFVTQNKNYLSLTSSGINVEKYLEIEKDDSVEYILPTDSTVAFSVDYSFFYQTSAVSDTLKGSLSDISMLKSEDIIYGRMPESDNEVVIDKISIENMFNEMQMAKQVGIYDVSDMIDKTLKIPNMDDFKIVGIVDLKSPSIYVSNKHLINIISNTKEEGYSDDLNSGDDYYGGSLLNYELIDDITIKEGRKPENDYEVIVNINNKEEYKLNKKIDLKVNGQKLKVVGYYTSKYDYTYYLVNQNTIKYSLITKNKEFVIYSNDKEKTISNFENLNIKDSYLKSKEEYKNEVKSRITITLIIAGIILGISLIEIFLMIRSSFLSRVKEVGILRAIGVKKIDICKMFLGEIFAITTIASLPGYLFMTYILKTLTSISLFAGQYLLNSFVLIASLIVIYGFNILIGLLPVLNVIRKTPAQILSRTDIE